MVNELVSIKCTVEGNPDPTVEWNYDTLCPSSKDCSSRISQFIIKPGQLKVAYLNLTAEHSGNVTCIAGNTLGTSLDTKPFHVTDVIDGFDIWQDSDINGFNVMGRKHAVAIGDSFTIHCGASKESYREKLVWFGLKYNSSERVKINNDDRHIINSSQTDYSHRSSMVIINSTVEDGGFYICEAEVLTDKGIGRQAMNITINVTEPLPPVITSNILKDKVYITEYGPKLSIDCNVSGIPSPTITWNKNGYDFLSYTDDKRIQLKRNGQFLTFTTTKIDDEGKYECIASNKVGQARKFVQLNFNNKPFDETAMNIIIAISSFILIVVIVTIYYFRRKARKLKEELKLAGLENFMEGDVNCLNPEIGLAEQAELLPYDERFEFPRHRLKFRKQLGSGAFGVVMKADAYGIIHGEKRTTVAIKMVKRSDDSTFIRALASELKIMIHLGKHVNVVNLLGACTNNVAKRELLVIVEYCKFGNLHDYLLRHRDNYVNQIDTVTGKIDFSIGPKIPGRSLPVSAKRSGIDASNNEMEDYKEKQYLKNVTKNSDGVFVTPSGMQGEDNSISSTTNSQQPELSPNCPRDYEENARSICTKDLITWVFQVARGMDYLSSRKVMHGDLAARNILLTVDNVVKICDFGMAKSVYKNRNYKKIGDTPLPVKWMALESIRDSVFSTQTDVWAFGIVLWEFFSLANTPYTGMEADEKLYHKLVEGYRMEPPPYSTKEIYQVMLDCWEAEPLCRPSFAKLVEIFGEMLEESVKQHYIGLNKPYRVMNTQRMRTGYNEYLYIGSHIPEENISPQENLLGQQDEEVLTFDNETAPKTSGKGHDPNNLPSEARSYTSYMQLKFHKQANN